MKGKTVVYDVGSTIYSPFSEERQVFLINIGYVIAYTLEDNGKKRIHLIYGPSSYFPVITTFEKSNQRASYEALTRVAATKFSLKTFVGEVKTNLELSNLILDKTVHQLGIFADIVINLHTARLEDRLLQRFNDLAKNHGSAETDGLVLPFKLKHHHLADMLGTERESVSRAIQTLKKKKLIQINKTGHFVIMT